MVRILPLAWCCEAVSGVVAVELLCLQIYISPPLAASLADHHRTPASGSLYRYLQFRQGPEHRDTVLYDELDVVSRVGPLKSGQLDATHGANYYELVLLVTTLLAFKLVLLVPIGSNLRGMTVRGEADPTRVRTHFNSRPTISNIFEVSANTRRTVDCRTAPTVRLSAWCRASTFT
jgi:hypothetical protein